MKHIHFIHCFIFSFIVIALFPLHAFAAQLYLTASRDTTSVGDTLLIHVVLDTEGEQLNVVDGSIALDIKGNYEFSTAGSVLSIWPTTPALSKDFKKMSFVGGVPDGFNSTRAELFDIAVTMNAAGDITLLPDHIVAYKNDGKGTPVTVTVKKIAIHVTPAEKNSTPIDEWSSAKSADTVAPLPFTISIGKESTVYEGKQFITFSTTDEGSGIDYYEVQEGMLPKVKSGGVYVLRNNIGNEIIFVSAYDKAGNIRTETLDLRLKSHAVRNTIGIFMVLIVIFVVLYRRRI